MVICMNVNKHEINVRENRRSNQKWTIKRKPKGQSKMDDSENLVTHGIQKTKTNNTQTQHNMCRTPLYANNHK